MGYRDDWDACPLEAEDMVETASQFLLGQGRLPSFSGGERKLNLRAFIHQVDKTKGRGGSRVV